MSGKPLVYVYSTYKDDPGIGISQVTIDKLEKHFELCLPGDLKADPSKTSRVEGALLTSLRFHLMKPFLQNMTSLKVVVAVSTGTDGLPIETFKKMGVKTGYAPGSIRKSKTVANYGLLLMLALSRGFRKELEFMDGDGEINFNKNVSHDVSFKTLGIVGLGRIGKELAVVAQALEMKVLYHNRNPRNDVPNTEFHSDLGTMLPQCDFVAICCPYNAMTHHLFSTHQFKLMKQTAMIINIARGKIIDTDALMEALQTGEIAGAGLDVTEPEPLPKDHLLFSLPNVIVTGHCASTTVEAKEEALQMVIDNLRAGIEGKQLPYEVQQ